MKLWSDKKQVPHKKQKRTQELQKDDIIRSHKGFHTLEKGRSRDGYLHSPENRAIAAFTYQKDD